MSINLELEQFNNIPMHYDQLMSIYGDYELTPPQGDTHLFTYYDKRYEIYIEVTFSKLLIDPPDRILFKQHCGALAWVDEVLVMVGRDTIFHECKEN